MDGYTLDMMGTIAVLLIVVIAVFLAGWFYFLNKTKDMGRLTQKSQSMRPPVPTVKPPKFAPVFEAPAKKAAPKKKGKKK